MVFSSNVPRSGTVKRMDRASRILLRYLNNFTRHNRPNLGDWRFVLTHNLNQRAPFALGARLDIVDLANARRVNEASAVIGATARIVLFA